MKTELDLRFDQLVSLLAVANKHGINTPFKIAEVLDVRSSNITDDEKKAWVMFAHDMVHELMYAPPGRG